MVELVAELDEEVPGHTVEEPAVVGGEARSPRPGAPLAEESFRFQRVASEAGERFAAPDDAGWPLGGGERAHPLDVEALERVAREALVRLFAAEAVEIGEHANGVGGVQLFVAHFLVALDLVPCATGGLDDLAPEGRGSVHVRGRPAPTPFSSGCAHQRGGDVRPSSRWYA